jgi:DNA polymerase-3 subunit beta
MKVVIKKEEFLNLLKTLQDVTDVNGSRGRPILSQVHLHATENRILFSANNLETSMVVAVNGVADLPGQCTFSGKRMLDLVKNMKKDKNVVLTMQEDGRLLVSQGRSRYKMNTMDPTEFPLVNFYDTDKYMPVDPEAIIEALKDVFYCTSTDEARINLNGVYFEPGEEGTSRAIATDGHRISVHKFPAVLKEGFILTNEACKKLLKILKDTEEVGLYVKDGFASFCLDFGVFNARTIAREYPPYRKIFPEGKAALISLPRLDTIEMCKRGSIFSGDSSRLSFTVNSENIVMTTKDSLAEAEEAVPLAQPSEVSEEISFGINAFYFLQALEHLKEDVITLRIYGKSRPIVVSEKNVTKAVMPMV